MMLVLYTKRHQTKRERTTDADGDIAYRLMRIAYKEDCREIRGMGAIRFRNTECDKTGNF